MSLIIPTYNRAALLAEAIKSCIAQTHRPIECIVVDDGSTDHTKDVVERLRAWTDDRFTLSYIQQDNAGAQVARNTGTKIASGDFIQYLDSDDLLYPHKLSEQVKFLRNHQDCDAVFGDWEVGTTDKKEKINSFKSDDLIAQFLVGRCIANFAILMRHSLVKKIGDWDVSIKRNQEVDFHLRGILSNAKFEYEPLLTGLWRTHESDRIFSTTGIPHILLFYRKWEQILKATDRFNIDLPIKISALYMWIISQDKNIPVKYAVAMLKESIRLNPSIPFYQNRKLKILIAFIGKNKALELWWKKFRRTGNSLTKRAEHSYEK